jgi:hypothetical protein
MGAGIARSVRSIFGHVFAPRVPADERAPSTEHDGDPEAIAFAEIVAASAILDFGGLPVEPPILPDESLNKERG